MEVYISCCGIITVANSSQLYYFQSHANIFNTDKHKVRQADITRTNTSFLAMVLDDELICKNHIKKIRNFVTKTTRVLSRCLEAIV